MTIKEYYAKLREHGYSVREKIHSGETVNLILQSREPNEFPSIMAPEGQTSAQRSETMAIFLRIYVL